MRIAVIDGQGGGIGKHITEKIRRELAEDVEIIALGTNALATALMLKAGANEGATGENAVVFNAPRVDIIAGSIAIIIPNAMLGEVTSRMAEAVAVSPGRKILLPLNRNGVDVVGVRNEPLPHQIDLLVDQIKKLKESANHV